MNLCNYLLDFGKFCNGNVCHLAETCFTVYTLEVFLTDGIGFSLQSSFHKFGKSFAVLCQTILSNAYFILHDIPSVFIFCVFMHLVKVLLAVCHFIAEVFEDLKG